MTASLQQQINVSVYLKGLAEKYPCLTADLAEKSFDELQKIYDHLASLDIGCGYQQTEQQLIECKARFAYVWSLAEISGAGSYTERGQWLTKFADLTIDLALRAAWIEVARKNKTIQKALDQNPGGMPGLFIFGMGKLGGGDLNFSSDVDLIAYFDPATLPVPEMLGKSYICHLVAQQLGRLLGQNNRPNFIWRVDWRLRPNASATTLAMSTEVAQEYYFFRASPWHRLALMKARIVAGDQLAGQAFLDAITPFIWRQNLDYRALDELAEIKQRINLEHPALRVERQWREPINDEVGGFNVKLGTGGIREIEFVANALQLVWGGKRYSLRTPNTVMAIRELGKLNQLDPVLVDQLVNSYKMLRRVENAIQIIGNQQTHLLPGEPRVQENLMVLLAENDWPDFAEKLNKHRSAVSECFEELFAEHAEIEDELVTWPVTLNSAATTVVEGWEKGFQLYGVSTGMRRRLKPLTWALADYLARAEKADSRVFDASATVLRLNDFFRSLPQGEQYFRLLAESPRLLESIIPPLLHSPAMSTLLRQSPHIIDCYMESPAVDLRASSKIVFDSSYVVQAERYEIRLERMRRFVNEQLYQLYLMFLQGDVGVSGFQRALSELAVHTLELALTVVAENLRLPHSPITVLGMGKVAIGRMSPLSDLDLIFIFDQDKTSLELASKFVSRLQTAISTPMREGIVYELDTRLRPSGRSGAPTVSIESFETHQ
ncbi:MAG: hypothetical protein HKN85_07725, partial [Gammaproteobacteria bacterium]|nr:hypothetical protein [Gammaproteobacteria bacterium]